MGSRFTFAAVVLVAFACKTPSSDRGRGAAAPRDARAKARVDPPAKTTGAPKDLGPVSTELVSVPGEIAQLIRLEEVVTDLKRPLALEFAPGDDSGRLFVVEQRGVIRILRGGKLDADPFLDVRKLVTLRHNEQGLLGLAFHSKFADNRRLYINYTDVKDRTQVVEYQVSESNPDEVDVSTAKKVLSLGQPWRNHNGGGLEFGPDGKLYIGTGDGGWAGDPKNAAQDKENLLGKMLRLDVDKAGSAPEVVMWGLRNPWRYAFDPATGDLYIGDVGQDKYEWINVVAGDDIEGHNFGWNVTEGMHCFKSKSCDRSRYTQPVVEFSHAEGCSITGGEVYRGKAIPELDGVYFYADYCTALLRSFRWNREGVHQHWNMKAVLDPDYQLANISSFGVDASGELYLLTHEDGTVWKLVRK